MIDEAAREVLAGTWRLVSYEDRDAPEDAWDTPFGDRPLGLGMYDRSGLLTMQVFADPDSPSTETFVAYIGTYVIREAVADGDGFRGVVDHLMQAASPPELLAEDPGRPFLVTGDTLALGDGETWRRRFERL